MLRCFFLLGILECNVSLTSALFSFSNLCFKNQEVVSIVLLRYFDVSALWFGLFPMALGGSLVLEILVTLSWSHISNWMSLTSSHYLCVKFIHILICNWCKHTHTYIHIFTYYTHVGYLYTWIYIDIYTLYACNFIFSFIIYLRFRFYF